MKSRDPLVFAFGNISTKEYHDGDPGQRKPFERRLRGIWRALVKQANSFMRTLDGHEKAYVGLEDVLNEMVTHLKERDAKWNPSRGPYVVFAKRVVINLCADLRDRISLLKMPSNARRRYRAYGKMKALPARSREARDSMTIALRPHEHLGSSDLCVEPVRTEERDNASSTLRTAMRNLTPLEALVVTRVNGLFGDDPYTVVELADALPIPITRIHVLFKSGQAKLTKSVLERQPCQ